jgi:methyltransferase
MSPSLLAYWGLLAIVVSERMAELVLSKRHADSMLRRGGVEYGRGHYPPMVALHTLFLIGCAVEPYIAHRPFLPWLGFPMLALALGAQALRWWAINTLGDHWNTRVIVLPHVRPIRSGPYRYFIHPNYLAVIVEGLALPLIHSAWVTAAMFSLLNALLLDVRIRTEDAALATNLFSFDGREPPKAVARR